MGATFVVSRPSHHRSTRHRPPLLLCLLASLVLPCLLPLCGAATGSSAATATSPSILSDYTITSTTTTPTLDPSAYALTTTTFTANETPNIALTLPFTFPYWSTQSTATLYASPNGALQLDNSYPCCAQCSSAQGACCSFMNYNALVQTPQGAVSTCSFAVSYNNLIAPFLTDLAPAQPPAVNQNPALAPKLVYGYSRAALLQPATANASAVYDTRYPFVVQYRNVPLSGQTSLLGPPFLSPAGVAMTFGVGLYASGRVDFYYWNVSDPALYDGWGGYERLLLAGLRQQQGQSQQSAYAAQYSDPNTLAAVVPSNGTYIPRSGVRSNTTWSFWPLGSSSCLGPTLAVTTGGTTLRIVVKDYANSTASFNFTCRYADVTNASSAAGGDPSSGNSIATAKGTYNVLNDEIDCVAPAAPVGSTYQVSLAVDTLAGPVALPINPVTYTYVPGNSSLAALLAYPPSSIQSLSLFCASCVSYRPALCWYDCSGTLHGGAYLDSCGTCVGGTTGRRFNDALDCNGVCYGPFVLLPNSTGECVCPPSAAAQCDALAQSTAYVTDSTANYIYSVNAGVFNGSGANNGGDTTVAFNDYRYIQLPYQFGVGSDPFPYYLNFPFPYMGNTYSVVYISPMGAIYLVLPSSACAAHAALAHFDGTNGCQYQMIAGYMAEFDAPQSSYVVPTWSYIGNPYIFVARYTNMHLAEATDPNAYVSFSITLYPTGRISINHYNVVPATGIQYIYGLPYTRQLLVGLVTTPRPAADLQSVYPSPFVPLSQRGNGLFALGVEQTWRATSVSTGVYPLRRAVQGGGNTIDFIPLGTNLCVSPYFGPATGGQLMRINPQLTSSYLPAMTLACVVDNRLYRAVYNATYQSFDCVVPAGVARTAVTVGLGVWDTATIVTTNRVYYAYHNATAGDASNATYGAQYSTDAFCGHCFSASLSINTRYCYVDCATTWRGTAYRDDCGSCVGGTTGLQPDAAKDCYGTCFGSFRPTLVAATGSTPCMCTIASNRTARQSGCTNVPTMRPAPTAYWQYIDGFAAADPAAPLPVAASAAYNNATLVALPSAGMGGGGSGVLYAVDLAFSFPWFGGSYRRLYVDEAGGVFFTNTTAACLAYGSSLLWQNSSASAPCLYSLIAAALTPDYPTTPTTSYLLTASQLTVVWQYGGNSAFSLTLSSGGGIAIDYRGVSDSAADYLVGVRLGVPALLMPFPFFITAASYTSSCGLYACVYSNLPASYLTSNELAFLPLSSSTTGYYPTRSRFAPTNSSAGDGGGVSGRLSMCAFHVVFCLSPLAGPVGGGTLVTLYNNATTCASLDAGSCCYAALNVTCSWGGQPTAAAYSLAAQSYQCVSPPGLRNGVVAVWLEESGRRIGTAAPLFFTYDDSAVVAVSAVDAELLTCVNCAATLPRYCWRDCTGTYRGNASNDTCGVCRPPPLTTAVALSAYVATAATYPYRPVQDCMGVCYGPFTAYNASSAHGATQCGCAVPAEPGALQRFLFPYTALCAVWQRAGGRDSVRQTLDGLWGYQLLVLLAVVALLLVATAVEAARWARYMRRRMKMTPAERERERRRRERRRQRERDRRERRRRAALGLPMPNQQPALPPGVAAMPVPPPPPTADTNTPAAAADTAIDTTTPAAADAAKTPPAAVTPRGVGGSEGLSRAEADALRVLHGMGFNDDAVLLPLVRKCRGDPNAVVNQLLR